MKIIIVTGVGKIGKSTTLAKDLRCWLKDQKAKEIKVLEDGTVDYEGVFEYKGKTIAIHSCGDQYYLVVFAIARHANKDILVLTGNTDIQSIAKLVEVIKENKNNPHCILKKEKATDPDNKRVLDEIIAEL
jgi:tRNA uridine 5-carbamoylmethylation protein Kti12